MTIIKDIKARQILDSRGNPTIEAEVFLSGNIKGRGMVPSGASTGSREATEMRDGDKNRYAGKEVSHAINKVLRHIQPILLGKSVLDQHTIDHAMIDLDATSNKSLLGANAILSVSLACAYAAAQVKQVPLYAHLNQIFGGSDSLTLPVPLMNIINGGSHADNNIDIQEFMIVPFGAPTFKEALRFGAEIFYSLKQQLKQAGLSTAVGDEGGFSPNLPNSESAIEFILKAIDQTGLKVGTEVGIALDVASSELYLNGQYQLHSENKALSTDQFIDYLCYLAKSYPILSIEDGLSEDDWLGWQKLTEKLGGAVQLVGDDLFVTNTNMLSRGINQHIANSILIKINQIGTLSETFDTIRMAQSAGYTCVISHRSGETEDTTIADLAVATNAQQIKAGSLCRSDRVAKYNQLLRIEEHLGSKALFSGRSSFMRHNLAK